MRNLFAILIVGAALCGLGFFATGSVAQGSGPAKPGPAGKATVINETQNVVSSELMGEWVIDRELSARLAGTDIEKVRDESYTFSESAEASKLICEKLEVLLNILEQDSDKDATETLATAMRSIYLAGEVEIGKGSRSSKHPFALVAWRGNPHFFLYREVNGRDDFESGNVMLARDKNGNNDLLFVGGDFNNETFRAFKRKPSED